MHARRVLFPLLAIISLIIAACGSPADTTTTTGASTAASTTASTAASSDSTAPSTAASGDTAASAASGEQIELRVAWWGSQNRHDRTLKVLDMFMQEHPNIKVTSEFATWDDYWTKMTTQAAGGNLPDVMQQDYQLLAEWTSRGLIKPLDEFVGKQLDLSKVDERYLAGGKIDGKLYGINLGSNSMVILLDPADFEKAGIAMPDTEWTWSDFEQICTQIKEKLNKYCTSGIPWNDQVFKTWLKEHGAWLYNADGTDLGYTDDKLYSDFFTMLLRMQEAGVAPTREEEAAKGTVSIEEDNIVTGASAMSTAALWSNQVVAITSAANNKPVELHLLPQISGGTEGHYLKPSMFFSVTANSQHPAEAAMLIDYITNNLEANKVLMAERGIPVSSDIREGLQPLLDDAQKKMFEYIELVQQHSSEIAAPDPKGHSEIIANVYTPLADEMLYGQTTPEEAAARFREQATAILAQNK